MIDKLNKLLSDFEQSLSEISSQAEILNLKSAYLGKKGHISVILKSLKDVAPEERKSVGAKANECKAKIEEFIAAKLEELELSSINEKLEKEWIDISLRDSNLDRGLNSAGFHPLTTLQRELEDVFLSMGFEILDGPHIEDDYHNFQALNIPADHPARDMQDTFWFPDKVHLLRTHTSPVQIRGMESHTPPFRFVVPGKCFRCERTDASHEFTFHQLEGMMVGEGISVANLIFFARKFFTEILKRDVNLRTRPGYFPFVEPGLEIDINCAICNGKGCSVCSHTGWVEAMGCGMVHPNVLKAGNIDPEKYSGFAFGPGIDRLLMMKYGIDDIRHLQSGDLRFVSQFRSY